MERNKIETSVADIPISQIGEIQQDHEILEVTDGGAHYKITRHTLPIEGDLKLEMLAMSVSGNPFERLRIIGEFTDIYGAPKCSDMQLGNDEHIDIIAWLLET